MGQCGSLKSATKESEMGECNKSDAANDLSAWVPKLVQHYLAHTESGCSICELARSQECHPSTILRQVRKLEQRRDDPLFDDALSALCTKSADQFSRLKEETKTMRQSLHASRSAHMAGLHKTVSIKSRASFFYAYVSPGPFLRLPAIWKRLLL